LSRASSTARTRTASRTPEPASPTSAPSSVGRSACSGCCCSRSSLDALKLPLIVVAIQIVLGVLALIFTQFTNSN